MIRVEFDSTLDELVDVNLSFASSTRTMQRQRLWSQVVAGGCLSLTAIGTVVWRLGAHLPLTIAAIVLGVAVVSGVLFGYLYGHFHDWYIRHHYRRMIAEMFGGVERIRCEFELRPDALWCRTAVAETLLPWSRLKQVNDADHGIELWFDPGLAVIRHRAFARSEDRRDFIDAVGRLRDSARGAIT